MKDDIRSLLVNSGMPDFPYREFQENDPISVLGAAASNNRNAGGVGIGVAEDATISRGDYVPLGLAPESFAIAAWPTGPSTQRRPAAPGRTSIAELFQRLAQAPQDGGAPGPRSH
ncbi:hypothetical protein [Nitrospirillum sp. BR 11828]|uniref:hypothetical protein n=1 Tax=Nitrospirillum sp. BR 11828 TaxID=3104325 RepID=UPI002ACA758D|nr:hypothetical protein [Nitrospirillum sp. BR 11828]MDZ5650792.1 hypothetical protein [Nitrospirillum sp. BR 11828]